VLHRRLRDERGEGADGAMSSCGGLELRALATRLESELTAERQFRQVLEARLGQLEEVVQRERREREAMLLDFSNELEATMRGLVSRIDDGLSFGAASMREHTGKTEVRLRNLLNRMDEGLSSEASGLQDTLVGGSCGAAALTPAKSSLGRQMQQQSSLRRPYSPVRNWDQAAELHGPRGLVVASPVQSITPAATPSLAYPGTLQVPGTGLSSGGPGS